MSILDLYFIPWLLLPLWIFREWDGCVLPDFFGLLIWCVHRELGLTRCACSDWKVFSCGSADVFIPRESLPVLKAEIPEEGRLAGGDHCDLLGMGLERKGTHEQLSCYNARDEARALNFRSRRKGVGPLLAYFWSEVLNPIGVGVTGNRL